MKVCIIFYAHKTLTDKNVQYSIIYLNKTLKDAADHLHFISPDIVFHNSGFDGKIQDRSIIADLKLSKNLIGKTSILNAPESCSVATDIQAQIDLVQGYDWYICLKADFMLPNNFYTNFLNFAANNTNISTFVNLAKFDLREHVKTEVIWDLLRCKTWGEIAIMDHGCHHYNVPDWGNHYHYIGYNGIDGCMHFYSEGARKILKIPHFMNQETWDMNIRNGIRMICGNQQFWALHLWHDIPRPDLKKNKTGHRF